MNYTKPSRSDGCWDIEQECHDEEECDYGPVEVFKLRRGPGPAGKGTRRPICTVEDADKDGPKSECGGNIALIITAPLVYESLKRAAETLRLIVTSQNSKLPGGLHSEAFNSMGDAECTLRQVQLNFESLMAGEHIG